MIYQHNITKARVEIIERTPASAENYAGMRIRYVEATDAVPANAEAWWAEHVFNADFTAA